MQLHLKLVGTFYDIWVVKNKIWWSSVQYPCDILSMQYGPWVYVLLYICYILYIYIYEFGNAGSYSALRAQKSWSNYCLWRRCKRCRGWRGPGFSARRTWIALLSLGICQCLPFCKPSRLLLKFPFLLLKLLLDFQLSPFKASFGPMTLRQVICSHSFGPMTLRQVICSHMVALMTRNLVEPQLQVMAVLIWICNLLMLRVSQSSPLVSNYNKTIYELITAAKFDLFGVSETNLALLQTARNFEVWNGENPPIKHPKKSTWKKHKNKPFMEWNQRTLPIQRKSAKKDCCSFKKNKNSEGQNDLPWRKAQTLQ